MRYYSDKNTLFIRGDFRAASTGLEGGIRSVPTLINHTVPGGFDHQVPVRELENVAAEAGLSPQFFGLLTAVPMGCLVVLQYDFVTVFITAGIRSETRGVEAGTVNIIACSGEGVSDAALLEMVLVATEAKAEALLGLGRASGTPTDAVIAACEGETLHSYAGRVTEVGRRVREAVLRGVPEALVRFEKGATPSRHGFFIFSRFRGEHWVEWTPENCPYYPCHFEGQSCDFCYCPFYPCRDESRGEWADSASGKKVWNCARCTLLHTPKTADYLKKYPGASLPELVRFSKGLKKSGEEEPRVIP